MLKIPEQAILCFEKWSKTRVVLYDLTKTFRPVISSGRNIHNHSICKKAKLFDNAKRCNNIDFGLVRDKIWEYHEGCLKYCHCGLLEWCMPVYLKNELLCILQAGFRRPLPDMIYPFPLISEATKHIPEYSEIPFVDIQEAEMIMEGLRQLAARLHIWYEMLHKEIHTASKVPRYVKIYNVFQQNYRSKMSLDTFAKSLCLSPSRAAHVIKETTGKSFIKMLNEYRMRDVCLQLQTTNKVISEIAYSVGFTELSHFYRVFKQQFKMTPRQYREAGRIQKYG